MTDSITMGAVHHLALTVTDLERAQEFYTGLLGFQAVMELSPTRVLLSNGSAILALQGSDPSRDRFNEQRVGLDHLSFGVSSHAELEAAARLFDQRGVPHGEIKDLGAALQLYVLAFRDPDNIQLELAAPYS